MAWAPTGDVTPLLEPLDGSRPFVVGRRGLGASSCAPLEPCDCDTFASRLLCWGGDWGGDVMW